MGEGVFNPSVLPHLILLILLIQSSSMSPSSSNTKPIRMTLIHVDSVHSPLFDEKTTLSQRSTNALRNSQLRAVSLNVSDEKYPLTPQIQGSVFLLWLDFGYPPVSQFLAMDTGSKLTWVFCPPCDSCKYPPAGLYDPKNSLTMKPLYCTQFCRQEVPKRSCSGPRTCQYQIDYAKGAHSMGYIVRDELALPLEGLQSALFGCSEASGLRGKFSGIFGLGFWNISIVSQWGYTKFSYCFSNITDINDETSILILGEIEDYGGFLYSTPLKIVGSHYFVTPIGILFGGSPLDVDLEPLLSEGVIIDTASTLSYFPLKIVVKIEDFVVAFIGQNLQPASSRVYRVCYHGVFTRDIKSFPQLIIQLEEDANFIFYQENLLFQVTEGMFCLAIAPCLAEGTNIIGVLAQQHYVMSYDLQLKGLTFEQMDCGAVSEKTYN